MKKLLERSRYLVLIAVVALLAASVAGFVYGVLNTVKAINAVAGGPGEPLVAFVVLIDSFLLATVLLIFGLALYELFVGSLDLPEWLRISHFSGLKELLTNLIILILAVNFLQKFVQGLSFQDVFEAGAAVALVSGALIAFNYFTAKSHNADSAKTKQHGAEQHE
ncbi:MAG: YqhA family protein [Anaerolineae bacterium]